MQQNNFHNLSDEFDEDINIDFKKIFLIIWSRKVPAFISFAVVLLFFVSLTFIMPKQYKVSADLYINKSNGTNMPEFNPYIIEESGSPLSISSNTQTKLSNELEILKSPLVMDKVVRDNNLIFKKKFGIIPNKKEGEYIPGYSFAKSKKLKIDSKTGTNVITIEFTSKDPTFSYDVVSSIIKNYVDVLKDFQSERAKNDTKILETEYNKVKDNLNTQIKNSQGLPQTVLSGSGNIAALSAFSRSAGEAVASIKGQYISGTKSQLELQEESQKVSQLATKLQWSKMVQEMSETSKVLVLREPALLRDFEYTSPKLSFNIILGAIFGLFAAFIAVLVMENIDKKLPYSALGDNVLYNSKNSLTVLKNLLIAYKNSDLTCIIFEDDKNVSDVLSRFNNVKIVNAELSSEFIDNIISSDYILLFSKVGCTDAELYRSVKEALNIHNKQILREILI